MKVCFPVQQDDGINSKVYGHFGSAPLFIVVDTDTNSVSTIQNGDRGHTHGACNPMKALNNRTIDAVVAAGIGTGALTRLNQLGIRVYRAQSENIGENILLFASNRLAELTPEGCCAGHGFKTGCAHN